MNKEALSNKILLHQLLDGNFNRLFGNDKIKILIEGQTILSDIHDSCLAEDNCRCALVEFSGEYFEVIALIQCTGDLWPHADPLSEYKLISRYEAYKTHRARYEAQKEYRKILGMCSVAVEYLYPEWESCDDDEDAHD